MAPLMFEVFTSKTKKNAFHIGAGAMVGVRLGSHTKMKYEGMEMYTSPSPMTALTSIRSVMVYV